MNFETDYTSISIDELTSGMKIDYEIYYIHEKEYVLLCKDVVLDDDLIKKFKIAASPERNIYIPNENYEKSFREKVENSYKSSSVNINKGSVDNEKPLLNARVAKLTVYEGYTDVKSEANGLFTNFTENNIVSPEITDAITQTIHTQINTIEASTIVQSINSIRKVDEYLHTHSVNVALLNGLVGKWLRFDEDSLNALVKIGLLHDIGKLSIPPEILNKPSKLTEQEFTIIKQHPIYSHITLIQSGVTDNRILQGVIQHHEKVNGRGYPLGLPVSKITDFARITAISDVYDAMVTNRIYQDAHSPFEVLAWFAEGAYSDLDINYVNIFLDCMIEELKGKKVLLSDGSIANVVYVHSSDFAYPIVQVDGNVIRTSPKLRCISMYDEK